MLSKAEKITGSLLSSISFLGILDVLMNFNPFVGKIILAWEGFTHPIIEMTFGNLFSIFGLCLTDFGKNFLSLGVIFSIMIIKTGLHYYFYDIRSISDIFLNDVKYYSTVKRKIISFPIFIFTWPHVILKQYVSYYYSKKEISALNDTQEINEEEESDIIFYHNAKFEIIQYFKYFMIWTLAIICFSYGLNITQ